MPKKWTEITKEDFYVKAEEPEREEYRKLYFDRAVLPNFSDENPEELRKEWDTKRQQFEPKPYLPPGKLKFQQDFSKKQPTWGARSIPSTADPAELVSSGLVDFDKLKNQVEQEHAKKVGEVYGGFRKSSLEITPEEQEKLKKAEIERNKKLTGLQQSKQLLAPDLPDIITKETPETAGIEETISKPSNIIGVTGIGGAVNLALKQPVRSGIKLLGREIFEDITWGGSSLITGLGKKAIGKLS
ncbi:MAG: hypothetical protein MIO92_05250, partial [Methanosarcinaceae archaeon]|nr:hypothetical protein [Methanosarcinaceae archaeon]